MTSRSPARYTLGIDLGATTTTVAVVDAHNRIAWERALPTRGEDGFLPAVDRVVGVAAAALAERPCAAAGVAAAAQVDRAAGFVVASPNLGFAGVPLGPTLAARLSLPVLVENDVNAAAYAEYLAPLGGGEPLLAVFAGTGVGGGLVADGRLFAGADGFAAEIGHVPVVREDGERCGCGRRGCLEAYAGGRAIVRRAAARAAPGGAFATVADVADAAAAGDAACAEVLDEAAVYLGFALAAAVALYNPAVVVLGGGVARAWPPLLERVEAALRARALPPALERLVVRGSHWGSRAGAVGAAALARSLGPPPRGSG